MDLVSMLGVIMVQSRCEGLMMVLMVGLMVVGLMVGLSRCLLLFTVLLFLTTPDR